MVKIERELDTSYTKSIFVYDESSPDRYSCIVVRKRLKDMGKKVDLDPSWEATDILVQQKSITPDYVSFMIEALLVAQSEAAWLESEYPTGQKLYKAIQ